MAIRTQGEHRRTSPGQLLRTRSGLQYTLPLCHAQSQRVADPVPKAPPSTGRCTPLSQCRALPSVCPGTSQGRAARGKMTRRNSTSPSALWDPHFLPAHPTPGAASPSFTTSGAGRQRNWGGAQDEQTDSRKLCPAVSSWDTRQRRIPLTSAFIGHTHCLWVSSQCLISLADRASIPTPGTSETAAKPEEKEKGPPPTHMISAVAP